ncbi:MAG TPA: hypothetical protein VIY73_05540 [Polyangiaceae bacterium]
MGFSPAPALTPAPAPALALLLLLLLPHVAFAQAPATFEDPYALPRAPRAPTLRELTHSDMEATLETTAGAIFKSDGSGLQHAYVQRLDLEVPVAFRRWFVGASYEVAGGNNGTGFAVVGGNLALDGRTVWATTTGLAYGGGLSVMLPTASYDPSGPASKVALAAATLRPWDVSYFVPDSYGIRPYVDVRAHDGPFVVQFRQGLDFTVSSLLLSDQRLYATLGLYLGWQFAPSAAAGLEVFEAYAIDLASVRDGNRESLVVSPNIRLALPWVQPAISAFTNLGPPISAPWVQRESSAFYVPGSSATVWGFRLTFTVVYDPTSAVMMKGK